MILVPLGFSRTLVSAGPPLAGGSRRPLVWAEAELAGQAQPWAVPRAGPEALGRAWPSLAGTERLAAAQRRAWPSPPPRWVLELAGLVVEELRPRVWAPAQRASPPCRPEPRWAFLVLRTGWPHQWSGAWLAYLPLSLEWPPVAALVAAWFLSRRGGMEYL